ncbi:putative Thaumatin family [Helianthus annuus]|uniref:Thaumatin family n=1 Tax=Helianthus annuus TaxID=4232 RepID=A0A9K3E9E6_HELAN|nr:thaumatin-like protein 1b [Helianthus annuus]KAF5768992.1 putative Thaumatin family [Helianthus annuus]KAJ0703541.1 putative Thaumatin family [Helianthus annuus]KAJ0840288.1 putative Thaumatin family [Helianthus annuus]
MAKLQFSISITLITLSLVSTFNSIQSAATFTLTNQCTYPVWAGLLSGAGTPPLPTTGFPLEPSQSNSISIPPSWSGRIWGRTLCSTDSTGRFTCVTGDCGSGTVECNGSGAAPPATLAEFTLNGANGMDFYDVSLVDGYNLPMMVVPQGESGGNCNVTGCMADLNKNCPAELRLTGAGDDGESVACRSACEAFGDPMYCCSGAYSTPQTCNPTSFSEYFKTACPTAYSYAYDDGTSTFTCSSSPNYVITFCPTPANSRKTTGGHQSAESNGSGSLANAFGVSSVTIIVFMLTSVWRL